jgi:hypothetical protein
MRGLERQSTEGNIQPLLIIRQPSGGGLLNHIKPVVLRRGTIIVKSPGEKMKFFFALRRRTSTLPEKDTNIYFRKPESSISRAGPPGKD